MTSNQFDKKAEAWSALFSEPMSDLVKRYTASVFFDQRLWRADIQGSLAHARMLAAQGIIGAQDLTDIERGMAQIVGEIERGEFAWKLELEDVHLNIEARLTQLVGDAGKRLHTGRSRNDQVATDVRLWLRTEIDGLLPLLKQMQAALVELAAEHTDTVMPGFTHLQVAQPVSFAHHLLAYVEMFSRDANRLADVRKRVNRLPLGAAALAGTSYALDRERVALELGFDGVCENSLDAVSDRDFVAETLFAIALCGVHASRMGEEIVLWASAEFGFASLGDAFTTGSSMLPQKKNSDVAELARGKSGRLVGNLTGLLVMLKGLPLAYNRDLQEDKEPLFDSVRTMTLVLRALSGAYASMTVHAEVMVAAAGDELLVAIDLAERLVERGVPFREAHERIGNLVGRAVTTGVTLESLVAEDSELQEFRGLFAPGASLAARRSPGGGGPEIAFEQRKRLESHRRELGDRLTR